MLFWIIIVAICVGCLVFATIGAVRERSYGKLIRYYVYMALIVGTLTLSLVAEGQVRELAFYGFLATLIGSTLIDYRAYRAAQR